MSERTIIRKATDEDHSDPEGLYIVDMEELLRGCELFLDRHDLAALIEWLENVGTSRAEPLLEAIGYE